MHWKTLFGAALLASILGPVSGYLINQGNYGPVAHNYPVAYTDNAFKAANTTTSKTLYTLSSNRQKLAGIVVDPQTAFSGTGISGVTCTVGTDTLGNGAIYAPALNIMQTTGSMSVGGIFSGRDLATPDSSLNIVFNCTATGANFGTGSTTALTQGNIAITIYTVTLPGAAFNGTPGVDGGG